MNAFIKYVIVVTFTDDYKISFIEYGYENCKRVYDCYTHASKLLQVKKVDIYVDGVLQEDLFDE